ncbi:hypothetical protein [Paenibacillus naphthalenovorans]|uniref:Uncharacterized protein n=1 Tax=Paenibacillus naphthalenovorans TaxID=162209 RepID=A0A0U2W3Z7_9BACL|nr:hypothetical protein [Paenibacillus naphthalenovorans]ALS22213.1 hypothetical protein IJ22_18390 [Paenibacillus naphthalenovorans]
MKTFEMRLIDKNTGEEIAKQTFTNSEGTNIKSGNEQKLPMIFEIRGDFTIYKEFNVGKPIRFKADGIDEEVKLIDMTNEMITIETSFEVGKKLLQKYI